MKKVSTNWKDNCVYYLSHQKLFNIYDPNMRMVWSKMQFVAYRAQYNVSTKQCLKTFMTNLNMGKNSSICWL